MPITNPFNVLLFSKTAGYRHTSICAGITALQRLSTETSLFNITASEDSTLFKPSTLSHYQVILLLHNTGTFFTGSELSALQSYVHAGGGVLAIHGAAAGMPNSFWYESLIGAHFDMHPDPETGSFQLPYESIGFDNPTMSEHFISGSETPPESWMDEWYNFTTHPAKNPNLSILLRGDTRTFKGGRHGVDHPLAWCQRVEGGRSVYIAIGHFDEAWVNEWFVELLTRAVLWAAGREMELYMIEITTN